MPKEQTMANLTDVWDFAQQQCTLARNCKYKYTRGFHCSSVKRRGRAGLTQRRNPLFHQVSSYPFRSIYFLACLDKAESTTRVDFATCKKQSKKKKKEEATTHVQVDRPNPGMLNRMSLLVPFPKLGGRRRGVLLRPSLVYPPTAIRK